jgi:hypothetical protein
MYLCYVDESGTPETPGNTSHFVLAGIALPIERWKECDQVIGRMKAANDLRDAEIHTAWIARAYREQSLVANFERLPSDERRRQVLGLRSQELLRLQRANNRNLYQRTKKFYKQTEPYIHLSRAERTRMLQQAADQIGGWRFARLFAECIDKVHFVTRRNPLPVAEQAFEQVISRLEQYLENTNRNEDPNFCLIVHDNNPTSEQKHTKLMQTFHRRGTFWTNITNIIETPLYVSSALTGMVQMADLCAYALRRFVENGETDLFNRIFPIADRAPSGRVLGVRHFSRLDCGCAICVAHRAP